MPMLIMPIIGIVVPASRHYHRNCVPYDRHHHRPDRDGGDAGGGMTAGAPETSESLGCPVAQYPSLIPGYSAGRQTGSGADLGRHSGHRRRIDRDRRILAPIKEATP